MHWVAPSEKDDLTVALEKRLWDSADHIARLGLARAANSGLTLLYWQIGNRIWRAVLRERRVDYG
jgi:hypothetical protein